MVMKCHESHARKKKNNFKKSVQIDELMMQQSYW